MKPSTYILAVIAAMIVVFILFESPNQLPPAEYAKFRTQAIKNLNIKVGIGLDDIKNENDINKEIDRLVRERNMR